MLIIHPLFASENAKCTLCDTIHIVNRVNQDTPNTKQNCRECNNPDFVIIDTAIIPLIPDEKMPTIDLLRHSQ